VSEVQAPGDQAAAECATTFAGTVHDRPFQIDIPLLGPPGSPEGLFHTEGDLGWRQGSGTFTYTSEDPEGNPCTTGALDWTIERVVQP
jgi:hypothetical protein